MMQGSCAQHDLEDEKGGEAARHAKHTHTHANTTFALTSQGLLGDMRHRAGDSACLATRVQCTYAHFLHNIRTARLKDERCDGGNCRSLLSTRQKK